MALYRLHHGTESNSNLYDPSLMKMFVDQHIPRLQLMENNRKGPISEKRQIRDLWHFYTFLTLGKGYFLMYKFSSLKVFLPVLNCIEWKLQFFIIYDTVDLKRQAHYKKMQGFFYPAIALSKSGQTIGTMLGCSLTPRATDMHKKTVEEKHDTVLQTKVQEALKVLNYCRSTISLAKCFLDWAGIFCINL